MVMENNEIVATMHTAQKAKWEQPKLTELDINETESGGKNSYEGGMFKTAGHS